MWVGWCNALWWSVFWNNADFIWDYDLEDERLRLAVEIDLSWTFCHEIFLKNLRSIVDEHLKFIVCIDFGGEIEQKRIQFPKFSHSPTIQKSTRKFFYHLNFYRTDSMIVQY